MNKTIEIEVKLDNQFVFVVVLFEKDGRHEVATDHGLISSVEDITALVENLTNEIQGDGFSVVNVTVNHIPADTMRSLVKKYCQESMSEIFRGALK